MEDVLRVREAFLKESGLKLSSLTASSKKSTETQSSHSELPLFLFGHSMGSYIARVIAARYPQNTAGVVLCGAGNQPAFVAKIGTILSRVVAAVKGQEYRSPLLYSLVSGSFISAIDDPRTEFDWLSTDPKVLMSIARIRSLVFDLVQAGIQPFTDLVSGIIWLYEITCF